MKEEGLVGEAGGAGPPASRHSAPRISSPAQWLRAVTGRGGMGWDGTDWSFHFRQDQPSPAGQPGPDDTRAVYEPQPPVAHSLALGRDLMLGRPGRGALSPPPARAAGRAGPLPEARTRGGPVNVWKNNPTKLTTPHRMSDTMDSRIHERFELTLPSPFTYGMLAAATAVEGGAQQHERQPLSLRRKSGRRG